MVTEGDATIALAARLMDLLHGASTTTTYKYALLLALIDLCQENVGRREGPTGSVTTRQVAERVVELYWPQTKQHKDAGRVLRQLSGPKRSIPDLVAEHRGRAPRQATTPHRARLADAAAFEDLIDEVEWVLIRYPIPLLQRLGGEELAILYSIRWREGPARGPVRRYQAALRGHGTPSGGFDNRLCFLPDVEVRLAALSGLLRPLIRREWTRFVAQCNGDKIEDLEVFLFEPQREDLSACRAPLIELQQGRCFYCDERLNTAVDVDHFLPWSRCGDDGLHNLVAVHARCNNQKSDHLAASAHLSAWRERATKRSGDLVEIARQTATPFHADRSVRLARSMYGGVPAGAPLWKLRDEFEHADRARLVEALGEDAA